MMHQRLFATTYTLTRLVLYLVLLAPVAVFVLHAFSVRWFYPQVLPAEWTLEPLLRQLGNADTREALWNSTQIALLVSVLSLLVGYPAARVLGLRSFRGKSIVYLLLFLPTIIPPVATGIGLNILFLRLQLTGTIFGVALVHLIPVLPYVVFTLASVFARYDINFEHQARVLGASGWRIFQTVTLPLVLPGLMVAGLFAFLISWSEYLLTLLIGGGRVLTLPLLLFSLVSGGNPTSISALALLFVALPALAVALTSRYLGTEAGIRFQGGAGLGRGDK
ncbi:MAG: ABC transporter permease subunit [Chloroflexaceae bacterium]|nr:ABC transporter permease subunit [Chloroflexaceae bacterium]NJO05358.1 ABC transporter permease subunit [Chloroflexaceae bacterium]